MIVKLWNKPHILYQSGDDDDMIPNSALAVHVDNGGSLIITQEHESICLNFATVPELCKLLKQLTAT